MLNRILNWKWSNVENWNILWKDKVFSMQSLCSVWKIWDWQQLKIWQLLKSIGEKCTRKWLCKVKITGVDVWCFRRIAIRRKYNYAKLLRNCTRYKRNTKKIAWDKSAGWICAKKLFWISYRQSTICMNKQFRLCRQKYNSCNLTSRSNSNRLACSGASKVSSMRYENRHRRQKHFMLSVARRIHLSSKSSSSQMNPLWTLHANQKCRICCRPNDSQYWLRGSPCNRQNCK